MRSDIPGVGDLNPNASILTFVCPSCDALHTCEGDFDKGEGVLYRAGFVAISDCEVCLKLHKVAGESS